MSDHGYLAVTVPNAEEAVGGYHTQRPAAVILDLVMGGTTHGLEALRILKAADPDIPIIVLSGERGASHIVQAVQLGASAVVRKPFAACDLDASLTSVLTPREAVRDLVPPQLQHRRAALSWATGERMAEVRNLIECVADTDAAVLIRGESGTGKELVAQALCAGSARRHQPFVKLNCAAVPNELLESELFGFERGAFTGAAQQKLGKFECAHHGTMFLDEIGDMGYSLQAKLLQVLQDGEFSRLGGTRDVRVDVRIIAATNRNLERGIAKGQFRNDLFFRLNVVCISVPPLRERRDEVPILCDYFLRRYSLQYNRTYSELSPETMRLAESYDWPGNIRELENMIKRTVVLGNEVSMRKELIRAPLTAEDRLANPGAGGQAGDGDMQSTVSRVLAVASDRAPKGRRHECVESDAAHTGVAGSRSLKDVSRLAARTIERTVIARMLQQTRWNRKETAANLGISYKALLYKMKEAGLYEGATR